MYGGFVVEVIGFEKASLGVVMAFILSVFIKNQVYLSAN
jgi:hypothetical protein